jgi:hypothetical protein
MLNVAILNIVVQTPSQPNSPLIIIHTYDAIEKHSFRIKTYTHKTTLKLEQVSK